jgi:hypothetical protein
MGRAFDNAMLALELRDTLKQALSELGADIDVLASLEPDAALGNGGLGRLAACFLDAMATLGIAGYGYGIRYDYGMFRQTIVDGQQVEVPDYWLTHGNPWEFARPEVVYRVQFGGHVVQEGPKDAPRRRWVDSHDVLAMAYDTIVPGYGTDATNTPASLVGQGHRRDRPQRLQPRQLLCRRGKQKPLGKRLARALPGRLHPVGPRTAAAPGILLCQCQRARPAAPLPQNPHRF